MMKLLYAENIVVNRGREAEKGEINNGRSKDRIISIVQVGFDVIIPEESIY